GIVFIDDSVLISAGSIIGGTYAGAGITAPVNGLLVEGLVGIGTSTPAFALDVNGVIQAASGFRTNSETITDFTGTGLTLSGGALMVDILSAADGTGSTASFSGFEFSGNELGLLQGCSDGQVLSWVDATNSWTCTAVTGLITEEGDITAV